MYTNIFYFTKVDEVVRFFTKYNVLQVPHEQQIVDKGTCHSKNPESESVEESCNKKDGCRSGTSSGKRLFNALSLLGVTSESLLCAEWFLSYFGPAYTTGCLSEVREDGLCHATTPGKTLKLFFVDMYKVSEGTEEVSLIKPCFGENFLSYFLALFMAFSFPSNHFS